MIHWRRKLMTLTSPGLAGGILVCAMMMAPTPATRAQDVFSSQGGGSLNSAIQQENRRDQIALEQIREQQTLAEAERTKKEIDCTAQTDQTARNRCMKQAMDEYLAKARGFDKQITDERALHTNNLSRIQLGLAPQSGATAPPQTNSNGPLQGYISNQPDDTLPADASPAAGDSAPAPGGGDVFSSGSPPSSVPPASPDAGGPIGNLPGGSGGAAPPPVPPVNAGVGAPIGNSPGGSAGGTTPPRGALRPALDAFNNAVNSVPGLPQALQGGAEFTKQIADDVSKDYRNVFKDPTAIVRLVPQTVLGEVAAEAKIGGAVAKYLATKLGPKYAGLAEKEVTRLVDPAGSALEQQVNTLVGQAEQELDAAATQAATAATQSTTPFSSAAQQRLQQLTDPAAIAKLASQRGANPRINKITGHLQTIANQGLDPKQVLSAALDYYPQYRNNPAAKDLITQNLLANLTGAQQAGALTPANIALMRLGMSARLGGLANKFEVDHLVSVDLIGQAVKELQTQGIQAPLAAKLGTSLANLRLTARPINRSMQETLTESGYNYAEQMVKAGLLEPQVLPILERQIRYVR